MNFNELHSIQKNKHYKEFIEANIDADTNKLRLKKFRETSFDIKFAILQIDCKKRIKKKLPEIYQSDSFLFPNILSTEQCTAEKIAKFHASLLNSQDSVLDMTAGLCIDTYYLSKTAKSITAIEINRETALIADFNMRNNTNNVTVICEDCIEYIKNDNKLHYDVIFIDPARRGDNNKRLFGLSDCNPNIIELIPFLKPIAKVLYIKASPMIDITKSIDELNCYVSDVWVIGISNECKELLFKIELNNTKTTETAIHTLNFDNSQIQVLSKTTKKQQPSKIYSLDKSSYLYEPNSCVMKAQIFDTLEHTYNVSNIQKNSHLFVSEEYCEDFPGRKFHIINIIPFKSNEIKNINKKHPQINVSVRNFRLSAEELKKKLKVRDGGNEYLFGTTDCNNNAILIICSKIL